MFAHGDFEPEEALKIAAMLEKELTPNTLPSRETRRKLIDISNCPTLIYEINCPHPDSGVLVYYQSRSITPAQIARVCFANQLISSSFFNELRTRQQLGYVVGTGLLPLNQHPGLIFYVQSPRVGPKQLQQRIDRFIDNFPLIMLEINEQQWQETKSGLLAHFRDKDTNLRSRSQRLWISIGNKDLNFEIRSKIAGEIEKFERSDLIRFMSGLRSSRSSRLLLCSHGQHPDHQEPIEQGIYLDDSRAFKLRVKKFYTS